MQTVVEVTVLTPVRGARTSHAKDKMAGRIIPFLELDFWDKHIGIRSSDRMSTGFSEHYRDLGS